METKINNSKAYLLGVLNKNNSIDIKGRGSREDVIDLAAEMILGLSQKLKLPPSFLINQIVDILRKG
jgi:hypothetical protein